MSRSPRLGALALGCALVALAVHLWAGWAGSGELALHPAGHLTPMAAIIWFVALGFAAFVAAMDRHGRTLAMCAIALCLAGFFLLLNP